MGVFPRITASQPAVLLAPMEGITDAPAREFLSRFGGYRFLVTEFFRISQDVPSASTFQRHAPELLASSVTGSGMSVQFQLLGGDPAKLAHAARVAVEAGATAIDLNFGCPAPTVNRNDGGATLLKYPDRIGTIVRAVKQAIPTHVALSAKMRLGWDSDLLLLKNAEAAVEGGIDWLTIHARTRMQGYAPPVDYRPVRTLLNTVGEQIPVVANGDLWTLDDVKRCQDITGCRHFMLGRSALANPNLVHAVNRWLGIEETGSRGNLDFDPPYSRAFWSEWFTEYAQVCSTFDKEPRYTLSRLKQWARIIANRGQSTWFDDVKVSSTTAEFLKILDLWH